MIETFQNIPQHSNPLAEDFDPHGIAAIQNYRDYFYLVVGDIGVGIKKSLALSPRYEKKKLTNLEAIKTVLKRGASRFKDEGRGGQLRRVCEIVSSLGGTALLRSGTSIVVVKGGSIKFWRANSFPGTQIAIRIPQTTLKGIKPQITYGEPPYYAYFKHPDGSWYMLWLTYKNGRENRWNVHATYDKKGSLSPSWTENGTENLAETRTGNSIPEKKPSIISIERDTSPESNTDTSSSQQTCRKS
jgi:hypothetical protein